VGETRAVYKASKRKRSSIRRGTREDVDFSKLPAFGMWADRTETDEELLGGGWGSPEDWSETDED
jgi:hypothetical protein